MSKLCNNQNCKKELPDDANFCGYCNAKQEVSNFTGKERGSNSENSEYKTKDGSNISPPIFYAEDYEVVRQFDPVITPTKEQVSFDNLLTRFQEAVKSKNYPFSVGRKKNRMAYLFFNFPRQPPDHASNSKNSFF